MLSTLLLFTAVAFGQAQDSGSSVAVSAHTAPAAEAMMAEEIGVQDSGSSVAASAHTAPAAEAMMAEEIGVQDPPRDNLGWKDVIDLVLISVLSTALLVTACVLRPDKCRPNRTGTPPPPATPTSIRSEWKLSPKALAWENSLGLAPIPEETELEEVTSGSLGSNESGWSAHDSSEEHEEEPACLELAEPHKKKNPSLHLPKKASGILSKWSTWVTRATITWSFEVVSDSESPTCTAEQQHEPLSLDQAGTPSPKQTTPHESLSTTWTNEEKSISAAPAAKRKGSSPTVPIEYASSPSTEGEVDGYEARAAVLRNERLRRRQAELDEVVDHDRRCDALADRYIRIQKRKLHGKPTVETTSHESPEALTWERSSPISSSCESSAWDVRIEHESRIWELEQRWTADPKFGEMEYNTPANSPRADEFIVMPESPPTISMPASPAASMIHIPDSPEEMLDHDHTLLESEISRLGAGMQTLAMRMGSLEEFLVQMGSPSPAVGSCRTEVPVLPPLLGSPAVSIQV